MNSHRRHHRFRSPRWPRLYKAASSIETLEPRTLLAITPAPAAVGVQPFGALSGRVVYTKGGHGYTWMNGVWQTQRPYINNMVEDMGNEDQDTYFVHYLLQAGATVVPTRPVDHQSHESVIDNSTTFNASTGGFSIVSGTWNADLVSTSSANAVESTYWSNNNGADTNRAMYATTSTNETAVARYTPNIPVAGYYPVYAWAGYDAKSADLTAHTSNRAPDQTFRINYSGGSYEVRVNLQLTGFGWIYLGNYYFDAGVHPGVDGVDVSNKSSVGGKLAIADAIRFGNGMGDVVPSGAPGPSGQPREEEAALYWDYDSRGWTGSGSRISQSNLDQGLSSDYNKDFAAATVWAAYMNNAAVGSMYDRIWLSFHSNASGSSGTGQGTLGLITGSATANQANLAKLAGTTVTNELTTLTTQGPGGTTTPGYDGTWGSANPPDHTFTGAYGEISTTSIGSEFDATIIEVAFHDNTTDAKLLEDPKVRDAVARATLHTMIDYFHDPVGNGSVTPLTNTTFLPEPPTDVRATTDASGNVTLNWSPGLVSSGTTGPYGNAATSYKVYTSTNGIGWDGGVTVTGATMLTFSGMPFNAPTYFRVTALNAGGESFGSTVVSAKPQAGVRAPILIVNNFTRLDRAEDQLETNINLEVAGAQVLDRVNSLYNNSQNYVAQAANAIQAFNPFLGIESCSDSAIAAGEISLSNYSAVIWMSGEQSSVDHTFSATVQPLVTSYLNAGGRMFISGSEIGWDLVAKGNGASFFTNTLKANYPLVGGSYNTSDDANTHSASGAAGSIFAGISLNFDDGTSGTYDVDFPDTIAAASGLTGVTSAMSYVGGTGTSAAIQYAPTSSSERIVFTGFPFETITTQSNRNAVMAAVLNFFNVNLTNLSTAPAAPALQASTDSGFNAADGVTNFNNANAGKALKFTVSGTTSGAAVSLFVDGTLFGNATAAGSSTTMTTNGSVTLSDGPHTVTATQTEPFKLASTSTAGSSVQIDTTAPTVSPLVFNFDTGQTLSYTFNEAMAPNFSGSSIAVANLDASTPVNTSALYDASSHSVVFNFPDGILASASYQATLNAGVIADLAGNALGGVSPEPFFFQMADANRDRTVNALDFNVLASNFGLSGKKFSEGNFNYDGVVNTLDFAALAAVFEATLAPAPSASVESVAPLTAPQASATPALFGSHRIGENDTVESLLA